MSFQMWLSGLCIALALFVTFRSSDACIPTKTPEPGIPATVKPLLIRFLIRCHATTFPTDIEHKLSSRSVYQRVVLFFQMRPPSLFILLTVVATLFLASSDACVPTKTPQPGIPATTTTVKPGEFHAEFGSPSFHSTISHRLFVARKYAQ